MAAIDSITLSTNWHGFQSLSREKQSVVTRTAQSYLISTLKDLSVGMDSNPTSAAEMRQIMTTELDKLGKRVKAAGIRLQ